MPLPLRKHMPHAQRSQASASWRQRCLLASLVHALCGCSFAFVETAPARYADARRLECTSSRVMPALDTVGASAYAVRTAVAASISASEFERYGLSKTSDIAISLGVTALFTAAAIHGYTATARCADAKRALAARASPVTDWSPPPL
jgi:hypothetical protein